MLTTSVLTITNGTTSPPPRKHTHKPHEHITTTVQHSSLPTKPRRMPYNSLQVHPHGEGRSRLPGRSADSPSHAPRRPRVAGRSERPSAASRWQRSRERTRPSHQHRAYDSRLHGYTLCSLYQTHRGLRLRSVVCGYRCARRGCFTRGQTGYDSL